MMVFFRIPKGNGTISPAELRAMSRAEQKLLASRNSAVLFVAETPADKFIFDNSEWGYWDDACWFLSAFAGWLSDDDYMLARKLTCGMSNGLSRKGLFDGTYVTLLDGDEKLLGRATPLSLTQTLMFCMSEFGSAMELAHYGCGDTWDLSDHVKIVDRFTAIKDKFS
jgi:hypothetical protein